MEVLNLEQQMTVGPEILHQVQSWLVTMHVSELSYQIGHGT
jgi:hypothetical protein